MTTPRVTENPAQTLRPVANRWFLDQCLSMRGHVVITSGERVLWCGTVNHDSSFISAANVVRANRDSGMTFRHTYRDADVGNSILTRLSRVL